MPFFLFQETLTLKLNDNMTKEILQNDLSDEFILKQIIFEIVLKTIPSILFIILGTIRYYSIRPIGVARISQYSVFYIIKMTL